MIPGDAPDPVSTRRGGESRSTYKSLVARRRFIASALVVAGIGVLASGCSASSAANPDARVVVAGQARLDEETDSVVLPLDKYAGPQDLVIAYAQNLVTQKCMAKKGFDYQISTFQGVDDPVGFRQFGLWDLKDAEQYGFGIKPDPAVDASMAMNRNPSTAEEAALPACDSAGRAKFNDPRSAANTGATNPGDAAILGDLAGKAYESTMTGAMGKKLIAAWQKCMTDKGIQVAVHGAGPLDAYFDPSTPLEQQIKIAVQEVECKTAPRNIIQQLVDIEASYQVVLIRKNQAVLNDQLTKINAVQTAAKKYVAANG